MNFDSLSRYLDTLPEKGIPGCDMIVMQDHKTIFRHMAGEGRPGEKMRGDETYWLYSATKVFTMTAGMQLVEKGLIKLDDPVSKYLPEFENMNVLDGDTLRPAKTVMTIQHLMSMQGGLDYDLNVPSVNAVREKYGAKATTRQIVEALAEKPLNFDPGTHMRYSLCHDVMAAVIEVASGMSFGEYVDENIVKPLGMQAMCFHPTQDMIDRTAACYEWQEPHKPLARDMSQNVYRFSSSYESGGAGLFGALESYILLNDALANDGVGATGKRILTRKSIDEMRTDRMTGDSRKDFDDLSKLGYSYGLGVRTLVDNSKSLSPIGEFGWDGAAGAWTMIDVDNHIAAFYVQHVHNCGYAFDVVHPTIRNLIYEGLKA